MHALGYPWLLRCAACTCAAFVVSACLHAQAIPSPIVNVLQIEPQGPALYPSLYRGVAQGSILYVTEQDHVSGNSNLEVIDISSPAAPAMLSKTPGSGLWMNGIAAQGQYVYVSYWQSSVVQVFDATNPYSLVSVGSVTTACSNAPDGGLYGGLVIAGDYLYAPCPTDSTGFIDVINIATPASPVEVGTIIAQNMTNPTSLAVWGQMLYASEPSEADNESLGVYYSSVCAYSLAGSPVPAAPVSCEIVAHSPQNVAVQGSTVAASIGNANELTVIDFSNSASPVAHSVALDPTICIHPYIENMVAFEGATVFVGCSDSLDGYGVEAIDITNSAAPSLLGAVLGSSGNSFATIVPNGKYLYLGGNPSENGNPSSTSGALYTIDTSSGINQSPYVTFLPVSLSFSSQAVGTTSATQSMTLNNPGTATLTINGISIAGNNSGDFAQASNCAGSVAAARNCTILVTFTPAALGPRRASLSFSDNAPGTPQTVPLSGAVQAGQSFANVVFNSIGSSSLFLELGEAAGAMLQTTVSGETYQ